MLRLPFSYAFVEKFIDSLHRIDDQKVGGKDALAKSSVVGWFSSILDLCKRNKRPFSAEVRRPLARRSCPPPLHRRVTHDVLTCLQ